jgi:hypothetical protein
MLKIMLMAEKSHGIEFRLFCRLREGSKLKILIIKNMPEKRLMNAKSLNGIVLKNMVIAKINWFGNRSGLTKRAICGLQPVHHCSAITGIWRVVFAW